MVLSQQFGGQGDFTNTFETARAGASSANILRQPINQAMHYLLPGLGAVGLEHQLEHRHDGGFPHDASIDASTSSSSSPTEDEPLIESMPPPRSV